MEELLIFRRDECLSRALCIAMFFLVFSCISSCLQMFPSRYERQGEFSIRMGAIGIRK